MVPVPVFSQKQLQMLSSTGKGLHGTHISSEILKSSFRVKDLVMTLFISSLDFKFFLILRFWDSGSHTWCATEVFYLRGCAEQSGSFVGFCGFVGNCLIAGQGFLKYRCFPHTHTLLLPWEQNSFGRKRIFWEKSLQCTFLAKEELARL